MNIFAKFLSCSLSLVALSLGAHAQDNVFPHGTFENLDGAGNPRGWDSFQPTPNVRLATQNGNRYAIVAPNDKSYNSFFNTVFALDPSWKTLTVGARMRVQGLKKGEQSWQTARISLAFLDESGKVIGYGSGPRFDADSDWVSLSGEPVTIPAGAKNVRIEPASYGPAGEFWVDDIKVFPNMKAGLTGVLAPSKPDAGGNVFAEGNFQKVVNNGPVGWKITGDERAKLIQDNGANHLRFANTDPKTNSFADARLKLDSSWKSVKVSVRIKATIDALGDQAWHGARLTWQFEDAEGQLIRPYPPQPTIRETTPDWVTREVTVSVPEGASMMHFTPGLWGASGVMLLDDIKVTPFFDAAAALDASLPDGQKITWNEEPVETLSATRSRVVLNGLWRFMPAVGESEKEPASGWGFIRVPGDWRRTGRSASIFSGVLTQGSGASWKGVDWQNLPRGWYERPLNIPASWKGRQILINLQRVSTDAQVWVNGVDCGKVLWPGGEVDITKAAKPGGENTLRLLVIATPDEGLVTQWMGTATTQVSQSRATLRSAGLIDDVLLESRPSGARVSDVFVQPSVRKKQLALDVELLGAQAGNVQFEAVLMDANGKEEKRFSAAKAVVAQSAQTIKLSWAWDNARLWDFDQPNLYTLKLSAKGAGVNDEYSQEFGFREFWIEGRNFLLNGKPFRMRPNDYKYPIWDAPADTMAGADAQFKEFKTAGFNFIELWPQNTFDRSRPETLELIASRADRAGMPISGVAPAMHPFIGVLAEHWNKPGMKARYEQLVQGEIRRLRNHPSIVMWGTSANFFGNLDDQNPLHIGQDNWMNAAADKYWTLRAAAGEEGIGIIKKYDPTRPVFTHHGAYVGDVHTLNHYMNWIPLQEREEWLSHWSKTGTLPFWSIEFGTPFNASFLRGRNGFGPSIISEPLMTEYSAIYLGKDAYTSESPEYSSAIRTRYKGGDTWETWQGARALNEAPAFQQVQDLFIRNTWRTWRTWGISGGMIPWDDGYRMSGTGRRISVPAGEWKPGTRGPWRDTYETDEKTISQAGAALKAHNSETLAWIGGAPEFVDKTHLYRGGETLRKQAVLINDARTPQAYSITWSVKSGDKTLASGQKSGQIGVAQNLFIPLETALPAVTQKTEGEVVLQAKIGAHSHSDRFAFRVFPGTTASVPRTFAVFDPAGETTKLLTGLGHNAVAWNGAATPNTIVIGRKALSSAKTAEAQKLMSALETHVQNGGRVLVMAQEASWMRELWGVRTTYSPSRRVFRVSDNHPVGRGLDDNDLRDWRGTSTLLAPYLQNYPKGRPGTPYYGWRWGNRHSVASAVIEKPHRAGWRPILETEFDLAFSPLLELDHGRGRFILSTLDLEDQALTDPAAQQLAQQLLNYASTAPLAPRAAKVLYIGGERGVKLLNEVGVRYQKVAAIDTSADILLIGEAPGVSRDAITNFAASGKKVIALPVADASALGFKTADATNFTGATTVPAWPETVGLSVSDVRWRTATASRVLTSQAGVEIGAGGQLARRGNILFAAFDPNRFDVEKETYFRLTRWRQMRALSQVLANAGASFALDNRFFKLEQLEADRVSLAGEWRAQLVQKLPPAPEPAKAHADPGISAAAQKLIAAGANEAGFQTVAAPGDWEKYGGAWSDADGEGVLRKTVEIPAAWRGKELILSLGTIDDFDVTYFNGERIGAGEGWDKKRTYVIPARLVREGSNVVSIRIWDRFGGGGLTGRNDDLFIKPNENTVVPTLYHPDYRADFELGDDPYRYYRW